MAIELRQLLEGLDDSTISQVEETIKGNAKELDAKLFIDGDGEHFIPHARFDEVVNQRDSANSSIKDYQAQIEELGKQVEAGSKAETTINDLKAKLGAQTELAKRATIETRLHPLVKDSIAPVADLLGFMDVEKILVNEDGTVSGLEEQLKSIRESRSYLFKAAEDDGEDALDQNPRPHALCEVDHDSSCSCPASPPPRSGHAAPQPVTTRRRAGDPSAHGPPSASQLTHCPSHQRTHQRRTTARCGRTCTQAPRHTVPGTPAASG